VPKAQEHPRGFPFTRKLMVDVVTGRIENRQRTPEELAKALRR